ncbi:hypothetical protein V6N13_017211 [Hibiscus sabdariffa]
MVFSPYFVLSLLPHRSTNPCLQIWVRNLFECFLGCLVFPSKDIVGLFPGGLIRFGRDGGWRRSGGRKLESKAVAKFRRVSSPSHVLGFSHLLTTIRFFKAIFRGLFPKTEAAGAWIRERKGFVAIMFKNWLVDETWVKAGGSSEAAKVKIREINSVCSASMVVFSNSGKVLTPFGHKEMVLMGRVSLSFQSLWLSLYASISDFMLIPRRYVEIRGIWPLFLVITFKTWPIVTVGTIFWIFIIMLFNRARYAETGLVEFGRDPFGTRIINIPHVTSFPSLSFTVFDDFECDEDWFMEGAAGDSSRYPSSLVIFGRSC